MAGIDEIELKHPHPTSPQMPKPHASRPHRKWLLLFTILLLGGGAYIAWHRVKAAAPPVQSTQTKAGSRDRSRGTVPVVSARARKGSVDVYINGLGVVTPIYTVTVKSRVDGQLMDVLYGEGQMVQK